MLARLPYRQYREWLAYYQVEPFGEKRADLRAAMIATTIANVNRDRKKRPSPFKLSDFMLEFKGERQPDSPQAGENMLSKMMAITKLMGGTIVDNRPSERD